MLKYANRMETLKSESTVYKIETCLGEGLSSCVYKAERKDSRGHSRQLVVLKILKNKNQVDWLRLEFEALSKVDSPFCVRMLAWENLKLGPALVLEYIDGVTLFDLLSNECLEAAVVNEILAQIQLGLEALKAVGRFHGDLNLKNIMIDRQGCVKLVDFATSSNGEADAKELFATPQYLAPEIWAGEPRSYDSDLYALGLIESDMRDGFQDFPADVFQSQLRAQNLIGSDSYYFCARPKDRKPKTLPRDTAATKQLAKLVLRAKSRREAQKQQTQALHTPSRPTRIQMATVCVLATFCFVVPVTSTPLLHLDSPRTKIKSATLEFRTKHWVEITIDGKNYGYAPLVISNVRPGLHNLKWTAQKSSGDMKFKMESGEFRIIHENEIARLNGQSHL